MSRFLALVMLLATLSVVVLAGCGGGGGTGVSPVSSPSAASTQQVYVLDFVHHTVSAAVQAQYVERNPIPTTSPVNSPDLALTLTFPPLQTGNPGREQVTATVTNNTTGAVGVNDQGATTGIDLCFVSTVFKHGSTVVPGGGYGGYSSLDPSTGTPIFTSNQSLAAGVTSPGLPISLSVPATATTATVAVIVRTDTVFMNEPDLTHWYLTTLAGQRKVLGYADGPVASALFHAPQGSLYREDVGDLLVADGSNGCIRRIYQGQVSTFATLPVTKLPFPLGLGRDSAGNVYVSDNSNGRIEVVPPSGGTPVTIFSALNTPAGVAVNGNLVYVCDPGAGHVKELFHAPSGSVFDPTTWSLQSLPVAAGFHDPWGVAVDAAGNVYAADQGANKIFVLPLGGSAWSVIAGTGASSEVNGSGGSATFFGPVGIAVDQSGIVYVADSASLRRLVHKSGALTNPALWTVTTLVPWAAAAVDGFTGTGTVYGLDGVSCARDGTLYLTEFYDVRRLDRTRN